MITYDKQVFGLNLLFRVHGSAVYRSVVPGLMSVCCLLLFRYLYGLGDGRPDDIDHPYAVGCLISSTTFLIVFRANNGYSRYWEAATAIHTFMSKTMDATIHTAVFHMQCDHYDRIKPPSYYDHPELNQMFLTRARERVHTASNSTDSTRAHSKSIEAVDTAATPLPNSSSSSLRDSGTKRSSSFRISLGGKDHHPTSSPQDIAAAVALQQIKATEKQKTRLTPTKSERDGTAPRILHGKAKLDGNWGELFDDNTSTYFNPNLREPSFLYQRSSQSHMPIMKRNLKTVAENLRTSSDDSLPAATPPFQNADGSSNHNLDDNDTLLTTELPSFGSYQGGRTPSLFLQELAHLSSLLCAVALSTLRNDIDGAQSPLGCYEIGLPWPEVDSDQIEGFVVHDIWYKRYWARFIYLLGAGKSPEERTRHNAARPLPVIGGVSDNEILFLQMARGPYAKVVLCWNWLSEFITREHLSGSTGTVGPPIISRLIQFLSDGMLHYNNARKIMFIPFPFPHAQLSSLFIFLSIPSIAYVIEQYSDNLYIASIFTFFSVACLSGIHEVARELENPFRNIPNELPLVTLIAQYNEAVLTMYSGYHPDHFWDASEFKPHSFSKKASYGTQKRDDVYQSTILEGDEGEQESLELYSETTNNDDAAPPETTMPTTTTPVTDEQKQNLLLLQSKIEEYSKEIEKIKLSIQSTLQEGSAATPTTDATPVPALVSPLPTVKKDQ